MFYNKNFTVPLLFWLSRKRSTIDDIRPTRILLSDIYFTVLHIIDQGNTTRFYSAFAHNANVPSLRIIYYLIQIIRHSTPKIKPNLMNFLIVYRYVLLFKMLWYLMMNLNEFNFLSNTMPSKLSKCKPIFKLASECLFKDFWNIISLLICIINNSDGLNVLPE